MVRALEPLESAKKKIELRRDQEKKKHDLESELIVARGIEAQKVTNFGSINDRIISNNLGINRCTK